jgi:hypothetical protein
MPRKGARVRRACLNEHVLNRIECDFDLPEARRKIIPDK